MAGAVDGEAPDARGTTIPKPTERELSAVGQASGDVGESAAAADRDVLQFRPARAGCESLLEGASR